VDGTIPTPTISVSGDTLTSSSGYTYQWYQDGTLISGATSQTYVPTANGDYQVIVTSDDGCTSDSSLAYTYTAGAATDNSILAGLVKFYPNPTTGILNIQDNAGLNGNFTVTVCDISGKILMSSKGSHSIDLSTLKTGIYFVTLSSEKSGFVTKKISLIR
jgi:hypothetical protein